jgi:uncharacterized FlgJ-related protein
MNIVQALIAIASLMEAMTQMMTAINQSNQMILKAQSEGRDMTNEELTKVQDIRKNAESAWKQAINK